MTLFRIDPPWYACGGWRTAFWCWLDEVCHHLWPMSYGHLALFSEPLTLTSTPWCCRIHDHFAEKALGRMP